MLGRWEGGHILPDLSLDRKGGCFNNAWDRAQQFNGTFKIDKAITNLRLDFL